MDLTDIKIAIIATDLFEETELTEPKKALEEAGAEVTIIAPEEGDIQGVNHHEDGLSVVVDMTLSEANAADYDAVFLPGGVMNADALRTNKKAQAFVQAMDAEDKPMGVICHGSWLLIDADLVDGRNMTSSLAMAEDLKNAGADWVDREVVVDGNWVSSRKPDDLPAFILAFMELIQDAIEEE
jgi:protease I